MGGEEVNATAEPAKARSTAVFIVRRCGGCCWLAKIYDGVRIQCSFMVKRQDFASAGRVYSINSAFCAVRQCTVATVPSLCISMKEFGFSSKKIQSCGNNWSRIGLQ